MKDYQESEFSPSIDTILKHFGTWNEAKKEANLRTYQQSSKLRLNLENLICQKIKSGKNFPHTKDTITKIERKKNKELSRELKC